MNREIFCAAVRRRFSFVALGVIGLLCHGMVQPLNAAAPFLTNSQLNIARAYHTTTLLQNGKLLVAGGYNGSPIAVSELYDPTTGSCATNSMLNSARYHHTATLLSDGKVLVAGGENSSSNALASAELFDPVSGTWTVTGSMLTPRFAHTATLLENGTVLVCGGQFTNGITAPAVTNGAEIYNPATGIWSQTGPMATKRYSHTATLLTNGTVLVAGGLTPSYTTSAELYNPASGTWTNTGSLNTDRYGHTATLLQNGQVLAAGGVFIGTISSAELYNPATQVWTPINSMNSLRVFDTATLLPNGKVLVASGYYNNSSTLTTNSAEIFDPTGTNWTVAGFMSAGRAFHTATQLPGGQIVFAGGYNGTAYLANVETYESTNGIWSALNSMSFARYKHTLTLLTNGQVLAAGGSASGASPTNTELYNPLNGTWTNTIGALHSARSYHTATLLTSGQVLVAGGYSASAYLNTAEIYNPASQTWTVTNHMANLRENHTATLLNAGQVLVAGGDTGSTYTLSTELFNPSTGTWATNGSLATARSYHTATLLTNGRVLVAGGFTSVSTSVGSTEIYDPSSGAWSAGPSMRVARGYHTATLLPSGKVLVAGGYNNTNYWQSSAEIYDPVANTWTLTGSMSYSRENHVARLLVNGQVLVAGGSGDAASFSAAEIYEPSTGVWLQVGPMISARSEAASAVIHNGCVLVSGGYGQSSPLSNAEAFLNFGATDLPTAAATNSSLLPFGGDLNFGGALFRGASEASGGNGSQDSASDYPLVQLLGLESGQSRFVSVTNWATNSLTSVPVTNFPSGWALATVMVNGAPGASSLIDVTQGTATVTLGDLSQYYDGAAESVTVTTTPPGLAVTVTYNGSTAPPTKIGSYTVVAIVNDVNYQGGATNALQILSENRSFGVDASHFQDSNGIPLTNWQQMYAAGDRFAIVKASEGLTGPDDPTMATNVANATQAGLLVGVYHFAHPENRPTTNGAVQEADHFLSYAGSAIGPGMLRPALDIETGSGTLTPAQMSAWALAFSQEIVNNKGAGAAPMVYCTQTYANENFDSTAADIPLWLEASGGGDPTYSNPPTNGFAGPTGVFTNWNFWQYGVGTAGGISPIDLDVCHEEMASLNSYLIPTSSPGFAFTSTILTASGFIVMFTNVPGTIYSLLASTNLTAPLNTWTVVGTSTESPPGQFQIVDSSATNSAMRFYAVRSP